MDEPQIRLAPGSIVSMVNEHQPHFVLQSPSEIRELRAALKQDQDLGLGEGGEADDSGLMQLVGLDLYHNGDVEGYDLFVHPAWILTVKQVTDRAWKGHQIGVGVDPESGKRFEEVERERIAETPKMILALKAAGVPVKVLGQGAYYVELDNSEGEMTMATHHNSMGAVPLLAVDAENQVCCCGHAADEHEIGSIMVERCNGCNHCGLFHRHLEDHDGKEQPAP